MKHQKSQILSETKGIEEIMKHDLNERIHDLRERSGMTQTELAARMGVTRSCVNAWEMGVSKPSLENLKTLGRIFHTTTDYLLGSDHMEAIVINDFSIEEKELIMHLIHYIENTRSSISGQKMPLPKNLHKNS